MLQFVTVTIASSGTASAAKDIRGRRVLAIQMPSAWTAANLTFKASVNGGTPQTVKKRAADGTLSTLTVTSPAANDYITLDPADTGGITGSVQLVASNAQAAARSIVLVLGE